MLETPQPIETVPAIAELEIAVEFMRFCLKCDSEQRFVADRECLVGLVGRCAGCGDEFLALFTRTTAQAA